MGIWIHPAKSVNQLNKSQEQIRWDVEQDFYQSAQMGIEEFIEDSSEELKGAAYDAMRERFENYELELCLCYTQLCRLLRAGYESQRSLTNSLFSGSSFQSRWDLVQIMQQREQLQSELLREQSLLNQLRKDAVGLLLSGIFAAAGAEFYHNQKINGLRQAINLLNEREAKMLAYNEQTKGTYSYAIMFARQLSASVTQLKAAVFNPAVGIWEGVPESWSSTLMSLARGAFAEINRLKERAGTPFDKLGKFGGNQADVREMADELAPIIRKYYPNIGLDNPDEINNFLNDYAEEGCGYMALANTLFEQYIGREAEFAERFGFPLKNASGDFNFEMLAIDFYCSSGGHTDWTKGLSVFQIELYWEKYISAHDLYVDVHFVTVTAENWQEISQAGSVIVGMAPVTMYEEVNGKMRAAGDLKWRVGGHAMVITGARPDGYLVVSSWSKTYYVNPKDWFLVYQQVSYS